MTQRRFHYELAFEQYLRDNAVPYLAVDEAKRTLVQTYPPIKLKSFDFVVYNAEGPNFLVDVKGRRYTGKGGRGSRNTESWVTEGDLESLEKWEAIFGDGYIGAFVFLHWCVTEPPEVLFQETFIHKDRQYAVWLVTRSDYQQHMRQRSPKWKTWSLPARSFDIVARPFGEVVRV